MKFELHNDHLRISVNSKGAEISSVVFNSCEYIWQAEKEVWPRHAPVLFPFVGKLKNDSYVWEGINYTMSQHGFARDKEFSFVYKTNTQIELELKHDAETLKCFPFEFKLTIRYKLNGNSVECYYRVTNVSLTSDLWFSIGAHPGFKIPLEGSESFTDYTLRFHDGSTYSCSQLEGGLLNGHVYSLNAAQSKLPITHQLFDSDALVFEDRQINAIELRSEISGKGVKLDADGWPYFGIWSKPGCNKFICLEPWYGIADTANSNGELKSKKGILSLLPGEFFNCRYTMEFF
jgi:galactose mutarotase-like enzyme